MELELLRKYKKNDYTIGKLYVNGEFFCNTIEDKDRGLSMDMPLDKIKNNKIYGQTAIPCGEYFISMKTLSPKYSTKSAFAFTKGYMPRILNVPGWEGVLIHTGNTQEDSLGCIIVGENKSVGKVVNSMATFKRLYSVLKEASDKGEVITIKIH